MALAAMACWAISAAAYDSEHQFAIALHARSLFKACLPAWRDTCRESRSDGAAGDRKMPQVALGQMVGLVENHVGA
ncbi:MAG: hypothetical protein QF797_07240, partial [Alphaproteobacteria bacterium]|nr:hypothetical protein [Alphaproteobacteria bacterium]